MVHEHAPGHRPGVEPRASSAPRCRLAAHAGASLRTRTHRARRGHRTARCENRAPASAGAPAAGPALRAFLGEAPRRAARAVQRGRGQRGAGARERSGHRGRRPSARHTEARPIARHPTAYRCRASIGARRADLPASRGRAGTLRRGGQRAARHHPRPGAGVAPCPWQVSLPALRGASAHRCDARAAAAQEPRQPRAARPRGHREVRRCAATVSPAPATGASRGRPLAHHPGDVDGARRRTRGPSHQPVARGVA